MIGGIAIAGLFIWGKLSGKGSLIPSLSDVIGGAAGTLGAGLGAGIISIPTGIARGLGAEKLGEAAYGVAVSPSQEELYFARATWGAPQTGIPTRLSGIPIIGGLMPKVPTAKVVTFSPHLKQFLTEATWRTSTAPANPEAYAWLEAERAKYVKAGCID